MSRGMKAKGSAYERELVGRLQDLGVPCMRVPLSGAMAGYRGDVIVMDEWLVEAKYRKDGQGFKTLYTWWDSKRTYGSSGLCVLGADFSFEVLDLKAWAERMIARINEEDEPLQKLDDVPTKLSWSVVHGWVKDCHAVAVRMPHQPWLVIEGLS